MAGMDAGAVMEAIQAVGKTAKAVAKAVGEAAKAIAGGVKDLTSSVGAGAKKIWKSVSSIFGAQELIANGTQPALRRAQALLAPGGAGLEGQQPLNATELAARWHAPPPGLHAAPCTRTRTRTCTWQRARARHACVRA